MQTLLEIHGIHVAISSEFASLHESLEHDFHYFLKTEAVEGSFRIDIHTDSRVSKIWKPFFYGPRSVLYRAPKGIVRACFFGKVWVEYDFAKKTAVLFGNDETRVYEVCYLVLLSYVGERLDLQGMHRVHGFGLSVQRQGLLVMGPSGSGKSTLTMECLKDPLVRVLSDDTPFLTRSAILKAFPQRIGISEEPEIDPHFFRKFKRTEYGEKFVVSSEYFEQQIIDAVPTNWVVLLQKKKARAPRLEEVSRLALILPCLKWLVLGYETPQIWELFVRRSSRDVVSKIQILFSRLRAAFSVVTKCRAVKLYLSDNPEDCAKLLLGIPQLLACDCKSTLLHPVVSHSSSCVV